MLLKTFLDNFTEKQDETHVKSINMIDTIPLFKIKVGNNNIEINGNWITIDCYSNKKILRSEHRVNPIDYIKFSIDGHIMAISDSDNQLAYSNLKDISSIYFMFKIGNKIFEVDDRLTNVNEVLKKLKEMEVK